MSARGTALVAAACAAMVLTPFAATARDTATPPTPDKPMGVLVVCLRGPDGQATSPGPTGRIWADGAATLHTAYLDDSTFAEDERCERTSVPAGSYYVGADKLRVPKCRQPGKLVRIVVTRGHHERTAPPSIGFALTGVAEGRSTRVMLQAGCPPPV